MDRIIISFVIAVIASLHTGCRMCQGPEDYYGPVIRDGLPTLSFCERHNSILSAGTYSMPPAAPAPLVDFVESEPVEDESREDELAELELAAEEEEELVEDGEESDGEEEIVIEGDTAIDG